MFGRPVPITTSFIAFILLVLVGGCGGAGNPFDLESESVIEADNVDALAFAPDGRLFFAEQFTGDIRIINADGTLQSQPFAHVEPALYIQWGLTGLALDPNFAGNHYVYAYYTEQVSREEILITPAPGSTGQTTSIAHIIAKPVVLRFTDQSGKGVQPKVVVDGLPNTFVDHPGINANGKIHFGPDGFLYISLGDYDIQAATPNHPSQDLSTPIGKLLRVNKEDGSPAPGNPFIGRPDADPRVFAYGFREPFDFAFHPKTRAIYGTDNTPVTCEELNIVEAGQNYGWPNVGVFPFSECGAGVQKQAIHYFTKEGKQPGDFLSFVETAGLAFVSAAQYPTLGDSLLACQRSSAEPQEPRLRRVVLAGPNFDQVTTDDVIVTDCKLAVAVSPDGIIYYSNDKELRRLIPPQPAGSTSP